MTVTVPLTPTLTVSRCSRTNQFSLPDWLHVRQLLITACIFLKPPRADTQGSVISSAPPAQTAQTKEEKKKRNVHFYSSCVVENSHSFLGNAQDLISYF